MSDKMNNLDEILNDFLEKFKQKFFKRVEKTDTCWNWIGSISNQGYGLFGRIFDRKVYLAHRVSWMLKNGSIPPGYFACHKCDNRRCVNPDHIFLGSSAENFQDMYEKHRQVKGENQWKSKLTEGAIRDIRNNYVPRKTTALSFARKYGVSPAAIYDVIYRRVWKHI